MIIAEGECVRLRGLEPADLEACAPLPYALFLAEAGASCEQLNAIHKQTQFWTAIGGAAAIVERVSSRLLGTIQFYRAGASIHGFEIGYVLHSKRDRGHGFATEALRLLGEHLFVTHPDCRRLQLVIDVQNHASARVANACGYQREGVLRKSGFGVANPPDCFIYARVR